MLEEKLEKAHRRSTDRTKKIAFGFFGVVALCGLAALALYLLDFYDKTKTDVAPPQRETPAVSTKETEREEFKELLTQYENELFPRLQAVSVGHWNTEAMQEMSELKKKAISSFSGGGYGEALATIRQMRARATELLVESEHIFQESFEKAAAFLAAGRYEEAKLHVARALMIAPHSSETLELQQEIDKLPSMLPLLQEVSAARSENDLQKEYLFLQQVVQISPGRREAVERIERVKRLLQEQKFEEHIALAFKALEKRQAEDARSRYLEARKVDPERRELAVLSGRLLALERSLRVETAVEQASRAVQRDDWQQAQMHFAAAVNEASHNTIAIEGKKRADLVVSLQNRLGSYISDPYRLADGDVRGQATKTLREAGPALTYSFGLKKQAQELQGLIEKMDRRVPVIIESDNTTYVLVRGVGKVGLAFQKQIELKPGNYIFEGRRKGFKSKLVRVRIPYDQDGFRLSVICDEPI